MKKRVPAVMLSLSAVALAGWIAAEGFTAGPVIPTKGDVPTIGHGSTYYEDGTRVTMADAPITRKRAAELAANLLDANYAKCVRNSLGVAKVTQVEFDVAVDFSGQYGCGKWRESQMLKDYKAGNYKQACDAYLSYRNMTSAKPLGAGWVAYQWKNGKPTRWKFDCSTPGNKQCMGVWKRQLKRHAQCMGEL